MISDFGPTLVIAAHPDDEVLGCGATIAKLTKQGFPVNVHFLSDGVSSRKESTSQDTFLRKTAAQEACKILGANAPTFDAFPDNSMDRISFLQIVQSIEDRITRVVPHTIFTHHLGDLNIDHVITARAVYTACRPQPGSIVRNIFQFEVRSSTEWGWDIQNSFLPNVHVDISNTFELKRRALECYAMEVREWPHARSFQGLKTLAEFRGSAVGLGMAESFVLGRSLL